MVKDFFYFKIETRNFYILAEELSISHLQFIKIRTKSRKLMMNISTHSFVIFYININIMEGSERSRRTTFL